MGPEKACGIKVARGVGVVAETAREPNDAPHLEVQVGDADAMGIANRADGLSALKHLAGGLGVVVPSGVGGPMGSSKPSATGSGAGAAVGTPSSGKGASARRPGAAPSGRHRTATESKRTSPPPNLTRAHDGEEAPWSWGARGTGTGWGR